MKPNTGEERKEERKKERKKEAGSHLTGGENSAAWMKQLWSERIPRPIDWERNRRFAVLLPLVEKNGVLQLLFEVRALQLSHQPGEVCFPGGAVEAGETDREAAVREAQEELLLSKNQIEVLAPLDILTTPANLTVTPFLAWIKDYSDTFSGEEVDRVFTIPLSWFLEREPECYRTEIHTVPKPDFPFALIPEGRQYNWKKGQYEVFFYRHEQAVIWGMTAKILYSFVKLYQKSVPTR